jgi:hypothetical protein
MKYVIDDQWRRRAKIRDEISLAERLGAPKEYMKN